MTGNGKAAGAPPSIGMLVWTLPVRLLNVSRSGCCIEVPRRVAVGSSGHLQVDVQGAMHLDDVRVARCQLREGTGGLYQVGLELLRTRRLTRRSLRVALDGMINGRPSPEPRMSAEANGRRQEGESGDQNGVSRAPPSPALTET